VALLDIAPESGAEGGDTMALTREDRVKLRNMLLYIADCMVAVNDMEQMHNCNDCRIKNRCAYAPEVGTPVRWNCPLWEEKRKEATP